MRQPLVLIFMFVCLHSTFAQRFEVGPFVGGANFIGDVGNTFYVNPNTLVAGGIAKWNQTDRYAFRFTLLYAKLEADDANSSEPRRQQRGYNFQNHIAEASLGLEINFWSYDLSEDSQQSTPYLYTGITYFNSKHQYLNSALPNVGNLEAQGDNWEFAIPVILGYKQSITSKLIAGAELGVRYTFTDNIDGSNPQEFLGRRDPPREFGNNNTHDWYVFTGVTLTYTFGRKPCYCHLR